MDRDVYFMQKAIDLARRAADGGEVPIGAVIVDQAGNIIGEGFNLVETGHCQDQHAELCAIRKACHARRDWRLDGCAIYVTLEPCLMCIGAISLSRLERLVYGADSPQYGYQGRREDICSLYDGGVRNVTTGVCREEVEELLRSFFRQRRTEEKAKY